MRSLEYSLEALNAKSAFYRADAIVYVEGDDDLMFWEEVFSRIPDFKMKIEVVGGSAELDKYISDIEIGALNAIAARDADFLRFIGRTPKSPRVIYTHGYAMENSLYTADVIYHVARTWCKSPAVTHAKCVSWLNDLETSFAPLVALDIANAVSGAGVAVLSDNCTKFMTSQSSATPCTKKIADHTAATAAVLPKKAIAAGKSALKKTPTAPYDNLRGHFIASAVIKFLVNTAKALGKKINVSFDALYAAAIAHFARSFTAAHPHYSYYTTLTSAAVKTF